MAPMASAPRRPTNMVSSTPMAIQPSTASTSGVARPSIARSSVRSIFICRYSSFADTERGENAIQKIVGRRRSGDRVDGPQRGVEIEQQHFVRNPKFGGVPRLFQRFTRFAQELLMPQAGDESAFLLQASAGSDRIDQLPPQFGQSLARESGDGEDRARSFREFGAPRQIGFIAGHDALALAAGFFDYLEFLAFNRPRKVDRLQRPL